MEIIEGAATIKFKANNRKLALEDYLNFIDNRTPGNVTVFQLRQIVGMHGFTMKEINKARKAILLDMVNSMDLMDLHHSTLLDDGVSGDDACITLTEVIKDLKDLDWDECHVTSLLTQNAVGSASGDRPVKRKKSIGLSRKPIEVEVDHSVISAGTIVAAGSTTESSRPLDVGLPGGW